MRTDGRGREWNRFWGRAEGAAWEAALPAVAVGGWVGTVVTVLAHWADHRTANAKCHCGREGRRGREEPLGKSGDDGNAAIVSDGARLVCARVRGHNALLYSLPSATFVFRYTNADKN